MLFDDLKLIEPILKALKQEGYTQPTPIQEQSIPLILDRKDLLGANRNRKNCCLRHSYIATFIPAKTAT
jgi:hypothetical protein